MNLQLTASPVGGGTPSQGCHVGTTRDGALLGQGGIGLLRVNGAEVVAGHVVVAARAAEQIPQHIYKVRYTASLMGGQTVLCLSWEIKGLEHEARRAALHAGCC